MASQATTYRGLATIGITTAVFGHETQTSLDQLLGSLKVSNMLMLKAATDTNLKILRDELTKAASASKNVKAWGNFALSRVNRDKRRRRKLNVNQIIERISLEIKPLLRASDIDLLLDLQEVEGTYFAMDIESIVLNLVSNAYFACKQKSKGRQIFIGLELQNIGGKDIPTIEVSDSGPGIHNKHYERIFEPLYTTKVDDRGRPLGTGLGLSIVSSILDDIGGSIKIGKSLKLKGARFTVLLG